MPTHAEKRVLPYSPEQMCGLVADVERYPEFLPWCVAARIRSRETETRFRADLVIGFKMIRERYTSLVVTDCPNRIDVTYTDGPFRHLNNHWVFDPHDKGCVVDFYIDFEFRNRMLQRVMGGLFDQAVRMMVNAFEHRAESLYGPSSQA